MRDRGPGIVLGVALVAALVGAIFWGVASVLSGDSWVVGAVVGGLGTALTALLTWGWDRRRQRRERERHLADRRG